MRISTVIPAYNCADYLQRAVDSLLATGYPNLEIVIVDDGSQDATWSIATSLQKKHRGCVIAIHHPERLNRGVSATRNLGIERSTGELICFLDADDYVYPHRFAAAMPTLQNANLAAVYTTTEMVFASPEAEATWGMSGRVFGLAEDLAGTSLLAALLRGRVWATSAVLLRRSLLAETGLFSERLALAEDCHLWWRMAWLGTVAAGDLSQPTGAYYRHASNCYQSGFHARLGMLAALLDFDRWSRRRVAAKTFGPIVPNRILDFAAATIDDAIVEREYGVCWAVLRRLFRAGTIRFFLRRWTMSRLMRLLRIQIAHACSVCYL